MPIEKAKITFYRIQQCGFYRRGETKAPAFGCTSSLLTDLSRWSHGKQLAATKTYEASDGADHLPVFLMDIAPGDGSWVVTMWNQTPATEGKVAAAIGTSSVGNPEVVMNDVPKGGIPGFSTYFWFIPDRDVFASIRFQHLVTGQKPMQQYMQSFLESFSQHVAWTDPDEDTDLEIAGYTETAGTGLQDVSPRFHTLLLKNPGLHEMILKSASSVRKVFRKTTLDLQRSEDLSRWQSMLTGLHLREKAKRPDQVRVKYEIPAALSREDIETMIASWTEQHDREWDDYGFKMSGNSAPYWLSHSLARKDFDLDVTRNSLEVVNTQSLLKALNTQKAEILRLIK